MIKIVTHFYFMARLTKQTYASNVENILQSCAYISFWTVNSVLKMQCERHLGVISRYTPGGSVILRPLNPPIDLCRFMLSSFYNV